MIKDGLAFLSLTPEQCAAIAAALGRRTSPLKAKAARENGKKGGRPRKQ